MLNSTATIKGQDSDDSDSFSDFQKHKQTFSAIEEQSESGVASGMNSTTPGTRPVIKPSKKKQGSIVHNRKESLSSSEIDPLELGQN